VAEPTNIGTLEWVALGLGRLLSPLEEELKGGNARALLAELGLVLPPAADGVAAFSSALQSVVVAAGQMPAQITKLLDGLSADDYGKAFSAGTDLVKASISITKGIADTASAIRTLSASTGIPPATLNAFADELPKRLVDFLVVRNLEAAPYVAEALEFIGIIRREIIPPDPSDPTLPELTRYDVDIGAATSFIQSPLKRFETLYDWGKPGFDGTKLIKTAQSILGQAGFPSVIDDSVTPPVLDGVVFELFARPDLNPRGLEIRFAEKLSIENAIPFNQGGDWQLEALTSGDIAASTSLVFQPNGTFTFVPPAAMVTGEYGLRFTAAKADGTPWLIFGDPEASRMQVKKLILEAKAGLNFDTATSAVSNDVIVGGEIQDGKLKIDFSSADGFIGQILSGINMESDFGFGFGFSSKEGLYFIGSATLEIQLPSHISLGPIAIRALTFSAGISDAGFPLAISADFGAQIGPIAAVVEQIGVTATFSIPADRADANLGPVEFALGFKPPKGVGLSVDAGPVKGGGYLFFDFDREEYAGAVELVFSDWIALRAIGLITTRMPDGSKGFSMLIIITVEFGTGIQLGFGFTLIGVGGLLGIHRSAKIEPLTEGVRTGAIESVMFPQDIIANAPKIISDLRAFFPPQQDFFLLGPMAKLGWGTPTLLSASLGIILEIPSINITIVGVIKLVLPTEEADILRIQVNFIGRIEPSNKLLWFYAELYDSRVLFITLEGGMGLLVSWGDPANFVLSVGGFHPRYSPPPLPFPVPPRLALSILNESYARIRVEAYFAVTANSVQFGAKAELFFGLSEFCIEGHLGFDALFQFDPFFFSFSISVSLGVKLFGIGLFSVGFSGLLEGPTPWHIEGKGSISLLFFDISVPFSHTWGDSQDTSLEPIPVFPLLEAELNALTNWRAEVPAGNNIAVSLRKLGDDASDQLVLHPLGSLRISQRKIPLNLKLDKVGTQRPADANQFSLGATLQDGGQLAVSDVSEPFATGQFIDLSQADRLGRPGFEPQDSGVQIAVAGEQRKTSQAVRRTIRYESIIIDNNFKRFLRPFGLILTLLSSFLFKHFLGGAAVAKSVVSQQHKKRLKPFDELITIQPAGYAVAFNDNNTAVGGVTTFSSHARAVQFMNEQIASDPALAERLHVIPTTELSEAA
jgi:hypothetical protein